MGSARARHTRDWELVRHEWVHAQWVHARPEWSVAQNCATRIDTVDHTWVPLSRYSHSMLRRGGSWRPAVSIGASRSGHLNPAHTPPRGNADPWDSACCAVPVFLGGVESSPPPAWRSRTPDWAYVWTMVVTVTGRPKNPVHPRLLPKVHDSPQGNPLSPCDTLAGVHGRGHRRRVALQTKLGCGPAHTFTALSLESYHYFSSPEYCTSPGAMAAGNAPRNKTGPRPDTHS